jgi:hypothetical protein
MLALRGMREVWSVGLEGRDSSAEGRDVGAEGSCGVSRVAEAIDIVLVAAVVSCALIDGG